MPRLTAPLRTYPTEQAARKAAAHLSSREGGRVATTLYRVTVPGAKAQFLLSSSERFTVTERRWLADIGGEAQKLGRFVPGRSFHALQTSMVRTQASSRPATPGEHPSRQATGSAPPGAPS